ncbi:hypothetical protein DH2020_037219 [Rehmannia glutinosa]|uniref:Retrotransposon Copia-like N-terminal domain-containing protein n=1 Tax=Rehmannia glutinosa TaxID=99300 RepID=A0ABR0V1S0_REHGL
MAESGLKNIQGSIDNNSIPMTSHKLTGHNYLQWSQSMMMSICGRGREDYLTGAISQPSSTNPQFKTWRAENNLVMSWLINSMTTEIGENFLLYSTAKEIWDAARDTFSSTDNTAELFQIENILHDLSGRFKKIVETKRIFKFLMGLNKSLDEVRGRILGTKPLPNLREVFSEVRRRKP